MPKGGQLRNEVIVWFSVPRMDPAAPAAVPAAAPLDQALAQAPALAQINGQEGAGNER